MKLLRNDTAFNRERYFDSTYRGIMLGFKKHFIQLASTGAWDEMKASMSRTSEFVAAAPFSNRVLGFLSSSVTTLYGCLRGTYALIGLDFIQAIVSFFLFCSGVIFAGYEQQVQVLPWRYNVFIFREFRFLFTPYGRCHYFLFLATIIGSYGSFKEGLYSSEISIVGIYLTFNALYMLYITWLIKHKLYSLKQMGIKTEVLKVAFNRADKTKNGQLNFDEIKQFFEYANINLDGDELEIVS